MENLDDRWHNLLFGVRRSVRYHNRRRMFFDRFHVLTSAISVIFGSATLVSILAEAGPAYIITAAAVVTIFSALDLVVGTAKMGRLYADLARNFIALEKDMISSKEQTEEQLSQFTGYRLDIEADEPPVLLVLDMICHNELMRAMGYDKKNLVTIRWYQRIMSQFVDLKEHSIAT